MRVGLLPVGAVPLDVLEQLSQGLVAHGMAVDLLPEASLPAGARDRRRRQYRAESFLSRRPENVLAVTTVDLFTEGLNFVFGLANAGACGAVVSLHRLAALDPDVLLARLVKESIHELGHTWGLSHCDHTACVMHFSHSIEETDAKGDDFCATCGGQLPFATLRSSSGSPEG